MRNKADLLRSGVGGMVGARHSARDQWVVTLPPESGPETAAFDCTYSDDPDIPSQDGESQRRIWKSSLQEGSPSRFRGPAPRLRTTQSRTPIGQVHEDKKARAGSTLADPARGCCFAATRPRYGLFMKSALRLRKYSVLRTGLSFGASGRRYFSFFISSLRYSMALSSCGSRPFT